MLKASFIDRRWRHPALVPLFFLALALVLRGFSFVAAVIDTDEGLYMLQAREWLSGGWPLVAVWDMHPVGAPAIFAVVMAIFGDDIWVLRVLGAVCVATTASALFTAVRYAGGPPAVGLGAGVLYIAHSGLLGGLATNTEILFAPFVGWAMALGLRGAVDTLERAKAPFWRDMALMGCLIGVALTLKPVTFFEGALAWLLLVVPAYRVGLIGPRRLAAMAGAYAAVCATPTLLFALAYSGRGELNSLLEGAFLAPLRYAGARLSPADSFRFALVAALLLLWAFLLSVPALVRPRNRHGPLSRLRKFGMIWFVAATLAVALPGQFYQHYFLIWLLPLSLLAALGARQLARYLRPGMVVIGFQLLISAVALDAWRVAALPRLDRGIGLGAPDPVRRTAAAVRAEIDPGDPIWVVNYHPVVYVLADAAVSTRYAFPAHLAGPFYRVTGIDSYAEITRILESHPRVLVIDRGWWPSVRRRAALLIEAALDEQYELVATVPEERGPVEIWRLR
ncbi:MAG: glycosyltransferase family 39 protein [Roseomonas sp.]|nr:glycosyltransferase family 39 protein [Roseomonas sp.]